MRSGEVLSLLRVSRQTLTRYVKEGKIRTETLPNGRYEYNREDVYAVFNKNVERKTVLYARVSTVGRRIDSGGYGGLFTA